MLGITLGGVVWNLIYSVPIFEDGGRKQSEQVPFTGFIKDRVGWSAQRFCQLCVTHDIPAVSNDIHRVLFFVTMEMIEEIENDLKVDVGDHCGAPWCIVMGRLVYEISLCQDTF